MSRNVSILSPSQFINEKDRFDPDTQFFWLGGAPRLRRQYETISGVKFNVGARFSGLFHQVFRESVDDLLAVYTEFQKANQSHGLWQTSIASKSSSSEPVVRSLVLMLCAARLAADSTQKTVLVVESPALGLCLSTVFDSNSSWYWRRRWYLSTLRLLVKVFAKHFVFFLWAGCLRIKAVIDGGLRVNKSQTALRVLMRTWITNGVVRTHDGKVIFTDRNFGSLRDYLAQQGLEVWLLPMFFNIGGSERRELRQLRAAGCKVLDEFAELSIGDIFSTVIKSLGQTILGVKSLELRSKGFVAEVGYLFHESHWRNHGAPDLLRLNLAGRTLARMAKRQVTWEAFYYPFENNASEKSFICAARVNYPGTQLIGFQHTVVFRDQLSMRLSAQELEFHPLPDRLLCSGPVYIPILRALGFPASLCELGANLRYTSIESGRKWSLEGCRGAEVLFVLNYNLDHAYEVLAALAPVMQQLCLEVEGFRLKLKLHPLIDRSELKDILNGLGFGEEVSFVEGAVQDEVLRSRITLMTGGSVAVLETLVAGTPLILYSLEQEFDFDCLWPESIKHPAGSVSTVRTSGELYLALRAILCKAEANLSWTSDFEDVRRAYFADGAAAKLSSFLPTKP